MPRPSRFKLRHPLKNGYHCSCTSCEGFRADQIVIGSLVRHAQINEA